jgi:outer membrane protein OmpA-like peptidoglycan-associated protein
MTSQSGVRRAAVLLAASAVLFANGCTTLDPYTREEQTAKATKGAIIGAVSGAVVGLISGDDSLERRQRALLGAGVGGGGGGGRGGLSEHPGNVTFATDSADLNAGFFEVLNSVGLVVNEYEQTIIEVAGHTDSTGGEQYNQALSERRATSVASYLQARDVLSERVITVGLGETRPVASNDTVDGRQLNRRVELTLVPLTVS